MISGSEFCTPVLPQIIGCRLAPLGIKIDMVVIEEQGLPDGLVFAFVVSRHMPESMMPKHNAAFFAVAIDGLGVSLNVFDRLQVGRGMKYALVGRQVIIKWDSGLIVRHRE